MRRRDRVFEPDPPLGMELRDRAFEPCFEPSQGPVCRTGAPLGEGIPPLDVGPRDPVFKRVLESPLGTDYQYHAFEHRDAPLSGQVMSDRALVSNGMPPLGEAPHGKGFRSQSESGGLFPTRSREGCEDRSRGHCVDYDRAGWSAPPGPCGDQTGDRGKENPKIRGWEG
jgi:hypothetical protein